MNFDENTRSLADNQKWSDDFEKVKVSKYFLKMNFHNFGFELKTFFYFFFSSIQSYNHK